MTVGQYTVTSGTVLSEQETADRLHEFMVGVLGWGSLNTVSDTGTDVDHIYFSEGEVPGKYSPIYGRARGNSADMKFYVYTNYVAGVGSDLLYNVTETQIPNDTNGGADDYIFIGNKDVVYVITRLNSNGANYVGGFGYWDTFYTPEQDPYPTWVMGQNANTDTFNNTHRTYSYHYDPDGFIHTGSTYSGLGAGFVAQDLGFLVGLHTPSPRDGRHLAMKQTFYNERARTAGIPGSISHEVRGELPGMYQFYGTHFVASDRIQASGIAIGDEFSAEDLPQPGAFVVARSNSTNAYTLGPVVGWDPPPLDISDIELWLKGDGVIRNGGGDNYGGRVAEWVDLSKKKRTALQTTAADQPGPNNNVINGKASVRFDNSDHLTGSLETVNDYTVFAVASYVEEAARQPVFYVRGDIGSNDYIFGVEFNNGANNSANVTVRTDDSPTEEDVVRQTGLTADTFYILSAIVSGTTTTLYVNGSSADSSNITNTKATIAGSTTLNYGVGTSLDSSGSATGEARHEGEIAEILTYTRDLTVEEHQQIVCYLGDKYGIAVSGTCP